MIYICTKIIFKVIICFRFLLLIRIENELHLLPIKIIWLSFVFLVENVSLIAIGMSDKSLSFVVY